VRASSLGMQILGRVAPLLPAFHHWHHTNDGPAVLKRKYAAMLPWVDKCFGTFYLPKKQWPMKYGIDAPMASSFARQLRNR
jgi:sterol desaturase/sphingolipid hydroxylase (fatty acid hydroxylase superfamily)